MKRKPTEETCSKCSGAGWIWRDELEVGWEMESSELYDDTQYTCDACKGTGLATNEA